MSGGMLRIEVSETRTIYVPMDRVRLTDLRIEGDIWEYELRIGHPEGEET